MICAYMIAFLCFVFRSDLESCRSPGHAFQLGFLGASDGNVNPVRIAGAECRCICRVVHCVLDSCIRHFRFPFSAIGFVQPTKTLKSVVITMLSLFLRLEILSPNQLNSFRLKNQQRAFTCCLVQLFTKAAETWIKTI